MSSIKRVDMSHSNSHAKACNSCKNIWVYLPPSDNTFLDSYTPEVQIILAFAFGLIFAPFNKGVLYLIVFFIISELVALTYYMNAQIRYPGITRIGLIGAGILGFIIGRIVIEDHHLNKAYYHESYEADRVKVKLQKHARLKQNSNLTK